MGEDSTSDEIASLKERVGRAGLPSFFRILLLLTRMSSPLKLPTYGGQAVIEGVMMRGRNAAAVAVRVPSGGILLHEEQLDGGLYAKPIARWPFVRGVILLW